MSLQLRARLGFADVLTLWNAVVGLIAMMVATIGDPRIVARLILLAAVADALDGIIARGVGSTEVGPMLDSIADVVSFGAAPALLVFVVAYDAWAPLSNSPLLLVLSLVVPAAFLVFSLLRTALYTIYVDPGADRPGIQNTLASSILAAGYLAGVTALPLLLAGTFVLSVLMVAPVEYPKLAARDAFLLGLVQSVVILHPTVLGGVFPVVLLVAALAYLTLAPRYYWEQ